MSERDIHISIVEYLQTALPEGSLIQHSANEGRRHVRHAVNLKRMGLTAGWPDLELIVPHWHFNQTFFFAPIFLEVKAPKGRVTKAQDDVMERLVAAGCYCAVVRSVEETEDCLSQLIGLKATLQ